jgi:hypothetical protein
MFCVGVKIPTSVVRLSIRNQKVAIQVMHPTIIARNHGFGLAHKTGSL